MSDERRLWVARDRDKWNSTHLFYEQPVSMEDLDGGMFWIGPGDRLDDEEYGHLPIFRMLAPGECLGFKLLQDSFHTIGEDLI